MRAARILLSAALLGIVGWFVLVTLDPYVRKWLDANRALAVQETSQQLRNAARLYRMNLRQPVRAHAGISDLVATGYLRRAPRPPLGLREAGGWMFVSSADVRRAGWEADVVLLDLGRERLLCEVLLDPAGRSVVIPQHAPNVVSLRPWVTGRDSGCFEVAGGYRWGVLRPGTYVYYARL